MRFPDDAAVTAAIKDALKLEGFLLPVEDGSPDNAKLRQHIVNLLAKRKVLHWRERGEKAISHGALVGLMFPHLPGPNFEDEPDPEFSQEVWDWLAKHLWSFTSPHSKGALQVLVGSTLGNGYVLIRVKIAINGSPDPTDTIYVTDDLRCILQDYIATDNDSLRRTVERLTANREMLLGRQPGNAKMFADDMNARMEHQTEIVRKRLELATDTAQNVEDDDEGNEE